MSPLLRLYLAFTRFSGPIWRIAHRRRLARGKEDADRLPEKYGVAPAARPKGRVLWFHALSVGESLALVPLIERALKEVSGAHAILTTSTVTSIAALEKARLPERMRHVLLPVDTARATARFLDHWQPEVAVFAELDFWPRLMVETKKRNIPMVLVNSRMSERSLESRARLGGMMRDVLRLFDRILLQDAESFGRFVRLGAEKKRLSVVGALKSAARPLPCDESELARLRAAVEDRPHWFAAATHPDEEAGVIAAHEAVCRAYPGALLTVAPRYMDSAEALEGAARGRFSQVARRSKGQAPDAETEVYIADTIGEMGLWYRLAPVSFIGHSLPLGEAALGGKNPFEAAALGSVILTGPGQADFAETYDDMIRLGAAREIADVESLAAGVIDLFHSEARTPMLQAAGKLIRERKSILDNTWASIAQFL
jgi:3-deoxy-D-manno-octulosonic-acid transferase